MVFPLTCVFIDKLPTAWTIYITAFPITFHVQLRISEFSRTTATGDNRFRFYEIVFLDNTHTSLTKLKVDKVRLELTAFGLQNRRSSQLNYKPKKRVDIGQLGS